MTDEVVEIESLATGGAGVTHLADGMIAFVPRTAPGDVVKLGTIRRHKRHALARVSEIVTPGPDRVPPPCTHFVRDHCGGCQWQHLSQTAQESAKRRIVGDALRRIGKLQVEDPPLTPSPRAFGYRTTITLTVRRRGGHVFAGFHDERDPDVVFPLEFCHIARPEVQRLYEAVAPHLSELPPGDDVRLKLRVATDGSLHVVVSGGEQAWTGSRVLADAAAPATVWWQPTGGAVRRVGGPEADPALVSFGQVNEEVAARLKGDVIAAAGAGTILDLYAGSGDTALPLAAAGHDVTMVELDARAVRRAEDQAKAAGVALKAIAGKVEQHLDPLLPADVVIVNPPRTGLGETVSIRLSAHPLIRLVYVSCDPATLARDLSRIGKAVVRVTAFDMFPQTSHVETLVVAE